MVEVGEPGRTAAVREDAHRLQQPHPLREAVGELVGLGRWHGVVEVDHRLDDQVGVFAANGMSTRAGKALIRDALVLDYRLPLIWVRTPAGQVPAWRARRIAQAVLGAPEDVVAHIDVAVAEIAHKVGPVVLDRLLEQAMMRLDPEQREEQLLEELHARQVRLDARDVQRTAVSTAPPFPVSDDATATPARG